MGYTTIDKILQTLNDNNVYFTIKEHVEDYNMSKNGGKTIGNNPSTKGE